MFTGTFSTLILHTSFVFELQQIFNCKSDALLSYDHLYDFIRTGKQNQDENCLDSENRYMLLMYYLSTKC